MKNKRDIFTDIFVILVSLGFGTGLVMIGIIIYKLLITI